MNYSAYTTKTVEQTISELQTNTATGIASSEIVQRKKQYGMNVLSHTHTTALQVLFRQLRSTFVYLLCGAAALSFLLGEILDGTMVVIFILINTFLGFFQEYRSEKTVQLLQKYVVPTAKVRRDGKEQLISSTDIVVGDVVVLSAGDIFAADIRITTANNLVVNESVLTGETVPVEKMVDELPTAVSAVNEATNIGFSGTTVVSGYGEGIVIAVGKNTDMGNVQQLTVETTHLSGFEQDINKFSKFILYLVFATLSLVFIVNLFVKGGETDVIQLVIFVIALTIGVIPEALPVVTTFSLSRGAMNLSKKHVIVKRLSAIEDLGGIEVLCSDKTGTITENVLHVADIWGTDKERIISLSAATALSDTTLHTKQPNNAFDVAIWKELSQEKQEILRQYAVVNAMPFDPERRRTSILVNTGQEQQLIVLGAPEFLIKFAANLQPDDQTSIHEWIAQQGHKGNRTIAVALKPLTQQTYEVEDEESGLEFIGCIAFEDPLKPSTDNVIDNARALGVQVKILTGDSREVAGSVASQIGLIQQNETVMTGEELEQLSVEAQEKAVIEHHVFARVSPQQKYRIIELLQKKQKIGFLGEGINDAPALKLANVSMVVNGASDIAREAADVVLLKQDLQVIIDGIGQGRQVFANTIKYIQATLSSNFGNFYAVAISSLFVSFLPMLPIQILLLNLLSDFPMIAIASDRVDATELKKPNAYHVKDVLLLATVLGLVSTVFDFIFFALFYKLHPESILQTSWFIGSILTELLFLFSIRTHRVFFRGKAPSRLIFFLSGAAAITTLAVPFIPFTQKLFHFTPLAPQYLLMITGVVVAYFITTETVKLTYYRFFNNKKVQLPST